MGGPVMSSRGISLNNRRKTWVFLLLGPGRDGETDTEAVEPGVQYWEVGVGNPDQLVRTQAEEIEHEGITTQNELVLALVEELNRHRYEDAILVVPDRENLQRLRRLLLVPDDLTKSLRGFNHVVIGELLREFFDQSLAQHQFNESERPAPRATETEPESVVSSGAVDTFWELWTNVFQLLPPEELAGDEL